MKYSRAGYAVIVGLQPVTGHLHILTGIMMDVMQPFHKAHYEVSHMVLLVWRSTKTVSSRLVDFLPVVLWVNAL
jgi:hypothetical protein